METLIVSLLFPTLAGYVILTKTPLFQYKYEYLGYHKSLLDSALVGMFLLFIVTVCETIFVKFSPKEFEDFTREKWIGAQNHIKDVSDLTINSESLSTILISLFFVLCFWLFKFFKKDKYYDFIAKRKIAADPNCMANLFADCFKRIQPVMINLKNRKSYIGLITDLGEATDLNKKKFIRILPTASGYRKEDDLDFQAQHSYNWLEIASRLSEESEEANNNIAAALKVSMVISIDEIVSATIWVQDLYEDLQSTNS